VNDFNQDTNWGEIIRSQVDLKSYVERYEDVHGDRAAHQVAHGSDSGTCMGITDDVWHCFHCDGKGSVIDYEMSRIETTDFQQACQSIADVMGITLPEFHALTPEEKQKREEKKAVTATVADLLNQATAFYSAQLTDETGKYLHGRGLTNDTIKDLRIGYAPNSADLLVRHLSRKSDDKDKLIATGLIKQREDGSLYDLFQDRYVFPYVKGKNTVYMIGRAAGNKKPYTDKKTGKLVEPHKFVKLQIKNADDEAVQHILWNLDEVRRKPRKHERQRPILITEGMFDAALARQALPEYAVTTPNTTRMNDDDIEKFFHVLKFKPRTRVVFCNDSEVNAAGAMGALTTAKALDEMLLKHFKAHVEAEEGVDADSMKDDEITKRARAMMPDIRIATLPRPPEVDKVDVADYVQQGRIEDLRYWLDAAMTLWRYEAWINDDPRRFFDRRGRATGDGTFRAKYLADELRLENYYLYVGERHHRYDGGVYVDNEVAVKTDISKKLKEFWKATRRDETLSRLSNDCHKETDAVNPPQMVNLKNGMLDIRGEMTKTTTHSPYYYSTLQYNADWMLEDWGLDMESPCPKFHEFLTQIVVKEDVPLIYEMIGYSMVASAEMHKAFLLVGEGANGKSTLLMVITELLKRNNICTISLQDLAESRWAPARMYGKAANIYPDAPQQTLVKSDVFKGVVAGDRIAGERKHRDHFEFDVHTTQIVSLNKLPHSFDKTKGFYRRLAIVNFPNSFDGKNAKNQKDLVSDLTTEEELNGIATQALLHYQVARDRGHFTESESSQAIMAEYQQENEPLLRFAEEAIDATDNDEDFLSIPQIHAEYNAWMDAEHSDRTKLSKRKFTKALREHLKLGEAVSKRVGGKMAKGWNGLQIKIGFFIDTDDDE